MTNAQRFRFPLRNRIVAAISDLVIVVDAPMKSGALITARMALELGKTVAAVPGSIFSYNSVGSNKLIEDGAFPLCSTLQLDQLVEYLVHRRIDSNYEQYIRYGASEESDSQTLRDAGRAEKEGMSSHLRMDFGKLGKMEEQGTSMNLGMNSTTLGVRETDKVKEQSYVEGRHFISPKDESVFVSDRILRNIENRKVVRKEREVSLSEYTGAILRILRKKTTATVFEMSDLVSLSITDCMDILDELCNEGLVRYEEGDTYRYIREMKNT